MNTLNILFLTSLILSFTCIQPIHVKLIQVKKESVQTTATTENKSPTPANTTPATSIKNENSNNQDQQNTQTKTETNTKPSENKVSEKTNPTSTSSSTKDENSNNQQNEQNQTNDNKEQGKNQNDQSKSEKNTDGVDYAKACQEIKKKIEDLEAYIEVVRELAALFKKHITSTEEKLKEAETRNDKYLIDNLKRTINRLSESLKSEISELFTFYNQYKEATAHFLANKCQKDKTPSKSGQDSQKESITLIDLVHFVNKVEKKYNFDNKNQQFLQISNAVLGVSSN